MTRVATPEQHDEARDLGQQIAEVLKPWLEERFPMLGEDDDARRIMARRLGWGLLMSTLLAASARQDNKIWIIEGFGLALGQVMAAQTDDVEDMILEALDVGIEAGVEDDDDGVGRPMGSA